MADLKTLEDIRLAVLYIQLKAANAGDPEILREAEMEFESLVDRFHREFPGFMTPRQYQTARNNYEYCLIFVDWALAHYRKSLL